MSKSVAILGTRGYPSYYGGFETAVRYLVPYLAQRGWDVTVYGRRGATVEGDATHDPRVKSIVTKGIESRSLSTLSHGLTSSAHAAWKKPDVALVMNTANGYFLPLLNTRRIASLVNVDGMEWERAKWGRLAKFVFYNGARATARFGGRMVYDSMEIAKRWKHEFGLEGEFIPYGGTVPGMLPLESGLNHRGYVLAVARFVPENTIPEFISASAEICKKWPVVIVGSSGYGGELENSVAQLARENANVHWLGHISDDSRLHGLWQHAGAYFHGHSVGGTNPALVQAMACGAPTVARDTPYNREVLGENAVFALPAPEKIIDAIAAVMSSPDTQERLSEGSIQRAVHSYSWDMVCRNYEQALERLIS